ncbi:hypothetical protein ACUH93_03830 [Dermabacteraceae bacterium P7006]
MGNEVKNKNGMLNRRSLAKAAAWGAPAVVMMGAAPKCQASVNSGTIQCLGPSYIDERPAGGRADLDEGVLVFLGDSIDLPKLKWTVEYVPTENNQNKVLKGKREIRAENRTYGGAGATMIPMQLTGDLNKTSYDPDTGIVKLEFYSEPVTSKGSSGSVFGTSFKVFNSTSPVPPGGSVFTFESERRADKVVFTAEDAATGEVLFTYDTIDRSAVQSRWNKNLNESQNRAAGWQPEADGRV